MDHHATTPVDERVLAAMLPYFRGEFGNPASRTHDFGWKAEEGVARAREQIAAAIGARAKEIVFTSGATESNNLALRGAVAFHHARRNHVVTVATEHHAVLDPLRALERAGLARVTRLRPRNDGLVDLEALRQAVTDDTLLVSVMHANNEIGVVQPIAEIGRIARAAGALFHCDAAQSLGKLPIDVDAMSIDLLSMSAHKTYGPKGIGALFVRMREPRVRLTALIDGGGHERGMRSGTLNVPGIVGMGAACELGVAEMSSESERLSTLRERLRARLEAELDGLTVNGALAPRLPGNLNVSFARVDAEALLLSLKGIAVSSGSACTSASLEPSHVLRAIGAGDERARSSVRFGLGRGNTQDEVDYVADRVIVEVRRLRSLAVKRAARGASRPGAEGAEAEKPAEKARPEAGR
jgi:cysteine desulfurase